ncbi:MAG: MarR family transcriptional regulator [Oscillospiraceae bacterium]|nr:MarR family transcriptional regulator [Oscillospiraceae bacterium]
MILIRLNTVLQQYNLFVGQPRTLDLIRRHPGITQRELAARMHISPAALSASLKRLVKNDWVSKTVTEQDLRSHRLYLTEAGEQVSLACLRDIEQMHDHMLSGLTEADRRQMKTYLNQICINLARENGTDYPFNE